MTREAVIFGTAGTFFGLLIGWIIGSQQAAPKSAAVSPATTQAGPATPGNQPAPPPLDLQRVSALEQLAKTRPSDAAVRVELGNLYQDSERPDLAIPWYEQALKLSPNDVNVSTDLAVCYYYVDQPDKALAQIERSLAIDPKHSKTLLNQGIIRAFGKQDLAGAVESWDKVIAFAPNSPDAARARTLKDNHGTAGGPGAGAGRSGRGGF
jgi:tetratricopeptide (TPR) repeat protein